MTFSSSVVFVTIFLCVAYGNKCTFKNFDVVWRLVEIEEWKAGKIMDVHTNNPRIVQIDVNHNTTTKKNAPQERSICKETLQKLNDLYVLYSNSSSLKRIEENSFEENRKLYHLDLQHNNLEKVPAKVFENTNIRILRLNYNKIKHIASSAFDNMASLEILDLSNNRIESLNPEWFKNTNKVIHLSLINNFISTLDANVFRNLKHTNDSDDSKLLNIYLDRNRINWMDPKAFDGLEKLRILSIANNNLHTLSKDAFKTLDYITVLDLTFNDITCVDQDLRIFEKASRILAMNNPWDCNCVLNMETKLHKTLAIQVESIKCKYLSTFF
ncbi:hypothetical protein AMK59_4280 [Oryctes borbonicus]|uniref:LRRCT domain-containing protein n=1 Tax=Oryctes borbonicus TaxID=1629725 RepID=A0A0T6B573_9SCAR|nr:hypothetical protein AMK59_4280 [Oryctes borbonicus]